MSQEKIYSIAVIGGGSAGIQATLRAVLNNDDVILFPGSALDKKRSRAAWVRKVENMPAHFNYRRGIEDPNQEVLKWISESEFAHNLQLMKSRGITNITKVDNNFELIDQKGDVYKASNVILCTGVMDVQPIINGGISDIFPYANNQSADYCLRCDGHHVFGKETAVIGHTDSAAWVAIMLYERYKTPNMILLTHGQEPQFGDQTKSLIEKYNFDIYTEEIQQVLGDPKAGKLEGFILCCGSAVNAQMSFVSLGMIVYNELAKELGAELDSRGFVICDEQGMSSVDGLYIAGDLKANTRKQIYDAWASAVTAADAINMKLRSQRR